MALADDDESVPGASLPSLVDDTLLLIATYLPACRDVLSLSILRVSPDGDGTAHDDAVCRELERRDRHRHAIEQVSRRWRGGRRRRREILISTQV